MSEVTKVGIVVDGRSIEVVEGASLVDVLRLAGIDVPTLCWTRDVDPPLGTCRVCAVRVDGREVAACTLAVRAGMQVECAAPDLAELQQGVVELLFAEGNHFCPACEKSGDCELQTMGYRMGMTHSRFPYRFESYSLDYRGQRLMLERNRCIHCKRCTDLFTDDEGHRVFCFLGKGSQTQVVMDLEREAKLSEHKCDEAVALCPVGAILRKGRGFDRPIGTRASDTPERMDR